MKVEHLQELIELARCRSFGAAAARLFISQPTLSVHVAAMERELGFQLVEHGRNSFALTPSGKAFLPYAQQILNLYDEGRACGAEESGTRAVRLYAASLGADLVRKLSQMRSPKVEPVTPEFGIGPLGSVIDGLTDMAAAEDFEEYPALKARAEEAGVRRVPAGQLAFAIAVTRDNPLAAKERLAREDVAGARVRIAGLSNYEEYKPVLERLLDASVPPDIQLSMTQSVEGVAAEGLRDSIHLCAASAIGDMYRGRADVKVFSELDGEPLLVESAIVYRNPGGDPAWDRLAEWLAGELRLEREG